MNSVCSTVNTTVKSNQNSPVCTPERLLTAVVVLGVTALALALMNYFSKPKEAITAYTVSGDQKGALDKFLKEKLLINESGRDELGSSVTRFAVKGVHRLPESIVPVKTVRAAYQLGISGMMCNLLCPNTVETDLGKLCGKENVVAAYSKEKKEGVVFIASKKSLEEVSIKTSLSSQFSVLFFRKLS